LLLGKIGIAEREIVGRGDTGSAGAEKHGKESGGDFHGGR